MTRVIVAIPTPELDGQLIHQVELPEDSPARLQLLQGHLGGYLELVPTVMPELWLFCNEDGQRLGLPVNQLASTLCQQEVLGPVVLHGGADSQGELLGIPDRAREMLLGISHPFN